MKRQMAMGLVLGLVSLPLSAAQEPEKPAENAEQPAAAEQKPAEASPDESLPRTLGFAESDRKPASQATGLIYIQPGTGRSDANLAPLLALLQSRDVQTAAIQAAAKQHLGQVPEDLKDVDFGVTGGTGRTHITSYDERVRADWVLDSLKQQISKELWSLDQPVELLSLREDSRRHLEQIESQWKAKRHQLSEIAKRHRLDPDPAVDRQRRLQLALEMQRLEVEWKGLSARRQILEQQLADLVNQPKDETSRTILVELQRVVEARQEQLARLKQAQARNDRSAAEKAAEQLAPTKAELAQAEVELARFRREASQSNSQRAVELRHRLNDTLVEIAEAKVKLDELSTLNQSLPHIDELRMEVDHAEHEYRRAREELDEIEAKLRLYVPPRVVLIRTK